MTLDKNKIKDWESTGRRMARRTLYREKVEYSCAYSDCGVTSKEAPKDAPADFEEFWPEERRYLTYPLQANHMDKDLTNDSLDNLEWLCAPHHKLKDSQTAKGVSTVDRPY